jgi:ABC-type multidrug transport system fused ATPase/permease subunit
MEFVISRMRDKDSEYTIKNIVLDFILENKFYMYCYLILSLGVPITNVYLPHLYGKLVSSINEKKTIDFDIKKQFFFIICIWLLVNFMWLVMNRVNGAFLPRLRSHVRTYVVDRVIDTYKENYAEDELGGIMANLVRLPDEVDKFFFSFIDKVLPVVYTIVGAMIYFVIINPVLGLVGTVTIGSLSWWTFKMVQRCFDKNRELNISHELLYNKINDSLGNLLNVYTANRDVQEKAYMEKYQDEYTIKQGISAVCSGNFVIQTNVSYLLLFSMLNMLSFYMFSKGHLKLENVVSILIVTLELISKMVSVISTVNKLMVETSIINHVQGSLDAMRGSRGSRAPTADGGKDGRDTVMTTTTTTTTTTTNLDAIDSNVDKTNGNMPQTDIIWDANGDITFDNVSLEYTPKPTVGESESTLTPTSPSLTDVQAPKPAKILNGVSLTIPKGTTTILTGHIGSGKTSLINSLIRLTPYSGRILINGQDIRELDLSTLRDQVLYVPQNPRLFDRTIYENISYGNDTPRAEVEEAMKLYGIKLDLDKKVGKFGQRMSGGQRQMVYLLRAIFKNAPIVVLDEPTASLDYTTKEEVMNLLEMLLETRTVIMVTHDQDVMKYADMIVTMENGKVLKSERGSRAPTAGFLQTKLK